jgi:HTH-type transcriptional regulator, sugar sensing transcriptional regulator
MKKQELVNTLIELGVRPKEAQLYLEMIHQAELSAGELHRLTGINRPRTYTLLTEMVNRGYCQERVAGRNRYYRAENPQRLLQRLKRELREKQVKAELAFEDLTAVFEISRKTEKNLDFIEVLHNSQQINQAYLESHRAAKEEILSFNRSPYTSLSPELLKEREDAYYAGLKRGLKYKSLYMMEFEHMEWLPCALNLLDSESNALVRCSHFLAIKLFVFDRQKVMFMLQGDNAVKQENFSMLVIEDAGFAATFVRLFEFEWQAAKPWTTWQAENEKTSK